MAASTIRRALAAGRLKNLGGGVYVSAAAWSDDVRMGIGFQSLAMQMRRPCYVASHTTAAVVLDLPLLYGPGIDEGSPRLEFTAEPGQGRRTRTAPRLYLRELPEHSVISIPDGQWAGLRVTSAARTAIDLAGRLPLPQGLMVTDHVSRQALSSYPRSALRGDLDDSVKNTALAAMQAARIQPWHTTDQVAAVLALTDPRRESPGESVSFGHMREACLPLPDCQKAIMTEHGWVYPDFWWEEFRLAGECDGRVKYHSAAGALGTTLLAESDRQHQLFSAGIHVIRWRAGDMMFRPASVLSRIRRRLLDLGWDGQSSGQAPQTGERA